MQNESDANIGRMRVIKKLGPGDRGAIKLAEQFGETLLCVRHRVDSKARFRFTTVELLISRTPIKTRPQQMVQIHIEWREQFLQEIVKAAGGKWDSQAKTWIMPRRLAGILRLTDRIVRSWLHALPHVAATVLCGNMRLWAAMRIR